MEWRFFVLVNKVSIRKAGDTDGGMSLASFGSIIICKNRSLGKFTKADPNPVPGTSTRCEVGAWLEGGAMVIQIPGNEHFVREPFHR
jgi:hypothetical protein